jgi:hypothetical protein
LVSSPKTRKSRPSPSSIAATRAGLPSRSKTTVPCEGESSTVPRMLGTGMVVPGGAGSKRAVTRQSARSG